MTDSARPCYPKMSRRRNTSPGWAAFDLNQRFKQSLELEDDADPYPSLSSSMTPIQNFVNNKYPLARSFSSLLPPSVVVPSLIDDVGDSETPLQVGSSSGKQRTNSIMENSILASYEKLEKLYSWADKSLIVDLMAAVDYNPEKASALLKAMSSSDNVQGNNQTEIAQSEINSEELPHQTDMFPEDKNVSLVESSNYRNDKNMESILLTNDVDPHGERRPDSVAQMKLIFGHQSFVPVEPEWEEDDIYLIHRKDALKMMRSASQHSRAACDAYVRGDHVCAQQLSVKAREERRAATRLNAEAATRILSMRNCNNNIWRLDLHGLHAPEAVEALKQRLDYIEQESILVSDKEEGNNMVESLEMEKKQQLPFSRQRPTWLEVITGKGNHSKGGEAALPDAIRGFLNQNRYRNDDGASRTGVIRVWPKFRFR